MMGYTHTHIFVFPSNVSVQPLQCTHTHTTRKKNDNHGKKEQLFLLCFLESFYTNTHKKNLKFPLKRSCFFPVYVKSRHIKLLFKSKHGKQTKINI